MIIDFHVHTFPPEMAAKALHKLSSVSHAKPFTDGTTGGLLASMRTAGIDYSLLLPVATKATQVPVLNQQAAQLNGQNGLLSLGAIHPDTPNWKQVLVQIRQMGLKGVKIHPVYQGVDLDDIRYLRILEAAGELGLFVLTHTGLDIGYPEAEHCLPKKARRAIDQVGPVTLVLAHMGGWRRWDETADYLGGTSAYLDTAFSTDRLDLLDGTYDENTDLSLLNEEAFVRMVRLFGVDRILFGTDSPWCDQKEELRWLKALPLSEEEKGSILGGNACRLLGLQ